MHLSTLYSPQPREPLSAVTRIVHKTATIATSILTRRSHVAPKRICGDTVSSFTIHLESYHWPVIGHNASLRLDRAPVHISQLFHACKVSAHPAVVNFDLFEALDRTFVCQ